MKFFSFFKSKKNFTFHHEIFMINLNPILICTITKQTHKNFDRLYDFNDFFLKFIVH